VNENSISKLFVKLLSKNNQNKISGNIMYLTWKGVFKWIQEAQLTFDKMNKVMSTCPMLSFPNFSQPFIPECDASGEGVGVVLMQNRDPIAYESHRLRRPELLYTIYEK
jgi:hypothetical protein